MPPAGLARALRQAIMLLMRVGDISVAEGIVARAMPRRIHATLTLTRERLWRPGETGRRLDAALLDESVRCGDNLQHWTRELWHSATRSVRIWSDGSSRSVRV